MEDQRKRLTTADLPGIHNLAERAFAQILLAVGHLEVYHEPERMRAEIEGRPRVTIPDFLIINTRKPDSSGIYVEITISDCDEADFGSDDDPKHKQRAILIKNGVKHVILYRHHLRNVQRAHLDVDFHLTPHTYPVYNH
ncbi:hypothetical protein M1523_02885 [Patescibacteria group bacterium]|nr:hypothetical protein [Patescibacteria group bacterium]MCL5091333.1 hypothetical protein [Patescibacteria group bacterium]